MTFIDKINAISSDTEHGSTYLLNEVLEAFNRYDPSVMERIYAFSKLTEMDSSMRVIHHFVETLKKEVQNSDFPTLIRSYEKKWAHPEKIIAKKLKGKLSLQSLTVLTHSHSQMVINVLKELRVDAHIAVIQTRSTPGGEGTIQSKTLREMGFAVELVEDEQIPQKVKKADCCLLGVDQYTNTRFVNKLGSARLVSAFDENEKKIFIIGDSRKKVKQITKLSRLFESVKFCSNTQLITEE